MSVPSAERLQRLPREAQLRALDKAWERVSLPGTDASLRAALEDVAKTLGLVRGKDGFTEAAGPSARHMPVLPASAARPAPLGEEALAATVGRPHLYVLEAPNGARSVFVGQLESLRSAAPKLYLQFSHYDHEAALRFVGEGLELHVAGSPHLSVSTTDGREPKVLCAVPASDLPARGSSAGKQRVRVAAEAKRMREEGVTPAVDLAAADKALEDPILGHSLRATLRPASPELKRALKIEQNTLAALLIDAAAEHAAPRIATTDWGRRMAFEAEYGRSGDAYESLGSLVSASLRIGLEEVTARSPEGPLAQARARLDAQLEFRNRNELSSNGRDALDLISTGAGTADLVTADLARLIPLLHRERFGRLPTPEEATAVFSRSRKLLRDLANADLQVFAHVLPHLQSFDAAIPGWGPNLFALVGEGDSLHVELRPEPLRELERELGASLGTTLSATTGCPALANVGRRSALDRVLDGVEKVLPQVFAQAFAESA